MRKVWCVKDKLDVWCAVSGPKPDESETGVMTKCGDWIILPHGIDKREPTCPKCRATNPHEGG